ncbi:MAG: EFR1 family ferrodoxin [Peptostreptococcaceae bacterium]
MIFYFSGTGNSLYIAKYVANKQCEKIISVSKEMSLNKDNYEYKLDENEKVIFIYPIYAWAPPKIVLEFIGKLKFKNYKDNYVTAIATCGENIGDSMSLINNKLKAIGLDLNSGFSIAMPNNYMIMGDVEVDKNVLSKLEESDLILDNINSIIGSKLDNVLMIEKGPMPAFMTKVINPLFNISAINPRKFYADENCIGCKLCEKVCNVKNITVNEKPIWGKKCTGCLACINYCPKKAIQFGKSTLKKGRYVNPKINIEEMIL